MNSHSAEQLTAHLAAGLRHSASAAQVAQAVCTVCLGTQDVLTPILGARGVEALFKRSLHLSALHHPGLAKPAHEQPLPFDAATLRAHLASLDAEDAAAAGLLFLTTFDSLLTSLIGPSLTERLLRPVWDTLLSGPPIQDIPT